MTHEPREYTKTLHAAHPRVLEAFCRYAYYGEGLGTFCRSAVTNKFVETHLTADDTSRAVLAEVVAFIHNTIPAAACGSVKKYDEWCKTGGIIGNDADSQWPRLFLRKLPADTADSLVSNPPRSS